MKNLIIKFNPLLAFLYIIFQLFGYFEIKAQETVTIYRLGAGHQTTNTNFWEVWELNTYSDAGNSTTWARIGTKDRPCGISGAIPRETWSFNNDTKEGYHLYCANKEQYYIQID